MRLVLGLGQLRLHNRESHPVKGKRVDDFSDAVGRQMKLHPAMELQGAVSNKKAARGGFVSRISTDYLFVSA